MRMAVPVGEAQGSTGTPFPRFFFTAGDIDGIDAQVGARAGRCNARRHVASSVGRGAQVKSVATVDASLAKLWLTYAAASLPSPPGNFSNVAR